MKKRPPTLTWEQSAGLFVRQNEMNYVAAQVLRNLPDNVAEAGAMIRVTVEAKPRSAGDDLATLADYIESGGQPPVPYVEAVLERWKGKEREADALQAHFRALR